VVIELAEAKIFVRERRKVSEGEKKPRYTVVAFAGLHHFKIKSKHLRKMEIEEIARVLGADVVYLQSGKDEDNDDDDDDEDDQYI
jgi:hypothetical protein